MSKNYSINIDDFTGIHRTMAEKANINGGDTLDIVEISIFNEIESTYDKKSNTFVFDNKFYNEAGKVVEPIDKFVEQPVSTNIVRQKSPEDLMVEGKNNLAIQNAKDYARQAERESKKTIHIQKNINGKDVDFSYNRASIEEYIINESKDSSGKQIKHFAEIYNIRNKPFTMRTKEESKKLVEFNNMVNYVINAGVEYGVDPKLIVAIVQREVGFNGLSDSVVGERGKGYMQLTSSPVNDMLGGYKAKNKLSFDADLKIKEYGPEIVELFKSRGFDVDCPKCDKRALSDKIMKYLKQNKDPEFNIRLGTLVLRKYLNKANGNVQIAAQNYNGHPKHKINYGKAIKKFYNKMNTMQN